MLRRTVFALALAFFCSAAFLPAQAQAAGKIGVANSLRISSQSDPGKEAEKQLQAMFGKERQELEKQRDDLNKQAEDFRKQAAALSEKARNERTQKLQKQVQDLDAKGVAYTQRLSRVQQAINAQITEVLSEAGRTFIKKNGFDMIIDASVVMSYVPDTDVTSGLIDEVNKVWKSKGGKFDLSAAKK